MPAAVICPHNRTGSPCFASPMNGDRTACYLSGAKLYFGAHGEEYDGPAAAAEGHYNAPVWQRFARCSLRLICFRQSPGSGVFMEVSVLPPERRGSVKIAFASARGWRERDECLHSSQRDERLDRRSSVMSTKAGHAVSETVWHELTTKLSADATLDRRHHLMFLPGFFCAAIFWFANGGHEEVPPFAFQDAFLFE